MMKQAFFKFFFIPNQMPDSCTPSQKKKVPTRVLRNVMLMIQNITAVECFTHYCNGKLSVEQKQQQKKKQA